MKEITRYASTFGIGALTGIANELIQNPNHWCLNSPNIKAIITISVGNVYGWGAIIALTFFDMMHKYCPRLNSGILLILLATVLVSISEGVFGQISKHFHNGIKTWQYPSCWVPMFDGYVSIVSSIFFGIGISLFYYCFYKPYL